MTTRGNFKRRVRARAAKTGQSYTTALRHFRRTSGDDEMPKTKTLRLAAARTTLRQDPRDGDLLRESGREIRRLMRDAYAAGARLVVFPEGATCSPHKRIMSADPNRVGPADWALADWDVLRDELGRIAELARELGLWTVLGGVHRLTPPNRPHNSLYVLSDKGEVVTRYDERMLSNTKVSFMYTPGSAPVTFEVDGVRIGLALGMEVHFPELFLEYERLDVDAVLFATAAPTEVFATEAQAHAATNSYWVGYASDMGSGVISPDGAWVARTDDGPVAVADLDGNVENLARPWRRTVRNGFYEPHLIHDDPRSAERGGF
ncbi:carbon-nitrogen hydrolase family protein [Kutzneria sp. 744]|uniref:carbon-nitrogen hydrolase family protein n=1 Tax=Kutzneria sp. (strain 744) TaxID=345341 RepID=UPI0004BAD5F5|nr:carbon-nitrogen hydrolase family protein [Kutzneria sp. 744]